MPANRIAKFFDQASGTHRDVIVPFEKTRKRVKKAGSGKARIKRKMVPRLKKSAKKSGTYRRPQRGRKKKA